MYLAIFEIFKIRITSFNFFPYTMRIYCVSLIFWMIRVKDVIHEM